MNCVSASAICAERPIGAETGPIRNEVIAGRLADCGETLREHALLWRSVAFRERRPAWEAVLPELAAALRALRLEQVEALHAEPHAAQAWLARWLPLDAVAGLEAVGAWPRMALRPWPSGFASTVPGRKWQQIEAFLGAVPSGGQRGIDWCAGKGHLARAACWQWRSCAFDALERDVRRVHAGEELVQRSGVDVNLHVCDVMQTQALGWLSPQCHVLALHACGALHQRLLQVGVGARVAALSCAPCCYHLTAVEAPLALSREGVRTAPPLVAADLRTAVQETVTAAGHARRQRRRMQQWQLGFDLLQRELRGVDDYLPLPAQPATVLQHGFAAYCRDIAAMKQLTLPGTLDFACYERAGAARFREVSAFDLVRHRFRRLLELWLVLDRAQFLVEAGYRVGVGTFCARELSPRNLLIDARLA
jgi:hypothetical protein